MAEARQAILDQEDLENMVFSDQDLLGIDLRGKSFASCRFDNLRLTEVPLSDCTFEDCVFESCDLTMAKVSGAAFHEVLFQRSKLMGIDWTPVRGLIFTVTFDGCNLTHATFAQRKMCGTHFLDCKAHEVTFLSVDLSQAVFAGSDLLGARFIDTELNEADLSQARNYQINPQQNRLRKTRFSQEAAIALAGEMGVIVPD